MPKLIHASLVCGLFFSHCFAQTETLQVLPWDGHSAAMSLTFDDASPVHSDVAVPELNKRHLRATFFVTVSKLTRLDDWRRAQAQGHEIGNHSVNQAHATTMTNVSEAIR